ncbi:MAG: BrnT family toxin [Blastocatellia bacterium]
MGYRFTWNEDKAASNIIDHQGITFDEASTVFDDRLAKVFDDETHSIDERREIIIGHSIKNRLLLVCFTERPGEIIRIISARLPTRKERKDYEENTSF